MGLLDLLMPYSQTTGFGPQKTTNPFTQWYDQNRGKVVGGFAGMAGAGNDPRAALQGAVGGLVNGTQRDDAYAQVQKADAEKQAAAAKQQADEAAQIAWVKQNAPQYAGLPAADAMAMAKSGGGGADPSDVATYKFYANQELKSGRSPKSFDEWFKGSKQAAKGSLGSPLPYKDQTGNYHPVQQFTDGSVIDLTTGQPPTSDLSYDPFGFASNKAGAGAFGAAQGGVQFNMPAAKQNVDAELANIDAIANDKTGGLDQKFGNAFGLNVGGVGFPNQWTPTLPNSPRAGIEARVAQVVGENFLQAYASLKGAGAITEVEGGKAQDAMARLNAAQSKADFLKALEDLKAVLKTGYDRMGTQAGSQYQGPGYQPPPLGGTPDPSLDDLLTKYGTP